MTTDTEREAWTRQHGESGKAFAQVPGWYLFDWLAHQDWIPEPLLDAIEAEWNRRMSNGRTG